MTTTVSVDFDHAIREVLSSSGQMSFKRRYRLDVVSYSWVKDYVKDQKARREIENLKKEIAEALKTPIDKDELQTMFEAAVGRTRQNFLEYLKGNLARAQRHECGVVGGLHEYGNIKSELPLMAVTLVSPEEISDIISDLPDGVKREKVEEDVEALRSKITKLNALIESELSPPDRWIYSDIGNPLSYPNGCRWTKFVEGWKKVVARFSGKCDIEGCLLKTDDEFAAFHMLELASVPKLTPLREPWE